MTSSDTGGQMKQLNVSLDWKRQMFTLEDKHTRAVEEAFIRLFEAGLVYRLVFARKQVVHYCKMYVGMYYMRFRMSYVSFLAGNWLIAKRVF